MTNPARSAAPLVSVVDDDKSMLESLPDLLRQFGFAAEAFASAEEFLGSDQLGETRCLILDVHMPGMSGPDLKQELERRGHRIPVIFITAYADAVKSEVFEGAVACLAKPFADTALREALRKALGV
jgi:FixJ family two-component response regulator